MKTVLIPQENVKDLEDIPDSVKTGLEIIAVSTMDEVLTRALTQPLTPIEWTPPETPAVAVAGDEGDVESVITH